MRFENKKKIGLVLSGGGIKAAAFHIGVCLALKEKGFKFAGGPKDPSGKPKDKDPMTIQLYVGSSAGAFISSILAAGYSAEALINAFQLGSGEVPRFNSMDYTALKPLSYRHIFAVNGGSFLKFLPQSFLRKSVVTGGLEAFIKNGFKVNGLFSTRGLERYLRKYVFVENDFSRLNAELYIVATQLNHTRKAIFSNFKESSKTPTTKYINYASISQAVACSAALPPIFSPYGLERPDKKVLYFYDGEIRETLSAHVAADHGCDLVLSSYSMQPYHFTEEMGSLHEYGIPVILNQALYQVLEQKHTKHVEWQHNMKQIYKTIDNYFKQHGLPEEHREKILEVYRTRFNYRPEVDYVHITPRPQNYEMFFVDHFSLSPKILERIVRVGFKSAISALRRHNM
ncbi:MAG: patatin-like phospholipase family protein [Bdellovibrionota bacterium]|mgnify:CR=1 FL=1